MLGQSHEKTRGRCPPVFEKSLTLNSLPRHDALLTLTQVRVTSRRFSQVPHLVVVLRYLQNNSD